MFKFRHLPWFFSLLLTIAACRVDREEDPVVIVTADPEFNVDLFEQRSAADGYPTFGLWIESIKTYDSANFGIETTVQVNSQEVAVQVKGIKTPVQPAGGPAPAASFVPIGNLANGSYRFSLSLGTTIVNEGYLLVADGHYTLSINKPQGVIFQNLVLEHIPDGLIWGYADTPQEAQQPIAAAFILDLKTVTADHGLPPGFYGYFTVTGAGSVFFHRAFGPQGSAEIFVRRLTATPDALSGVLQSYRTSGQAPLEIRCLTTFGAM